MSHAMPTYIAKPKTADLAETLTELQALSIEQHNLKALTVLSIKYVEMLAANYLSTQRSHSAEVKGLLSRALHGEYLVFDAAAKTKQSESFEGYFGLGPADDGVGSDAFFAILYEHINEKFALSDDPTVVFTFIKSYLFYLNDAFQAILAQSSGMVKDTVKATGHVLGSLAYMATAGYLDGSGAQSILRQLSPLIATLENWNETLQISSSKDPTHFLEMADAVARLATTRQQHQRTVDTLAAKIEAQAQAILDLQAQVSTRTQLESSVLADSHSAQQALESLNGDLTRENQTLSAKVLSLQAQLESLSSRKPAETVETATETDTKPEEHALQAELAKIVSERDVLLEKYAMLEAANTKIQQSLSKRDETLAQVQQSIADMQPSIDALAEIDPAINHDTPFCEVAKLLLAAVSQLKNELSDKDAELAVLKSKLTRKESFTAELARMQFGLPLVYQAESAENSTKMPPASRQDRTTAGTATRPSKKHE